MNLKGVSFGIFKDNQKISPSMRHRMHSILTPKVPCLYFAKEHYEIVTSTANCIN
jgi:hypothetical protein